MVERQLDVAGHSCLLVGDAQYLGNMAGEFEPATAQLLMALCLSGESAVDVGANIGLTALVLAKACQASKIIAIEPVATTYAFLKQNLQANQANVVSTYNTGLGAKDASISMYVNDDNLATAFVLDYEEKGEGNIPVTTLDAVLQDAKVAAVDFLKIDVEGFELEVLKGAEKSLATYKPIVLLEMNHWCLNIFHRIALPDFKDQILKTFPFVYAVNDTGYYDFSDHEQAGMIMEQHVFQGQFMDIVAGFDKEKIEGRLKQYIALRQCVEAPITLPVAEATVDDVVASDRQLAAVQLELEQTYQSLSWKLTKPLRYLNALFK